MKKLLLPLLMATTSFAFGQNYKDELQKVNEMLTTFDHYHPHEVKIEDERKLVLDDGVMEKWIAIDKIAKVEIKDDPSEVNLLCKNNEACVKNAFMLDDENKLTFATKRTFDMKEFAKRLQALVNKLQAKK